MRTWTLAVSVCVHAAVVVAIFVAPIFATADLPDPRRPLTFEAITPIATPAIPITPRPQQTQPSKAMAAFPVVEPSELPPDLPAIDPPAATHTAAPEWEACTKVKGQRSKVKGRGRLRAALSLYVYFVSANATVTVITTGTAVPFNNVGVNFQLATA